MEELLYKHKKKIIVGVAIIFLTIIGVSIYSLVWNGIHSAKVNIVVAPSIAKIRIDGDEYSSTGEFKIRPGEHEAEIFADGFISKKVSIVATEGEVTNLYDYLDPTDENINWYDEHDSDADTRSAILVARTDEIGKELAEKNPIMNVLPTKVEYFTNNYVKYVKYNLRYEIGDDKKITIIIDDFSGGNKDLAMEKLKSFGYDLSKYEIKYNNRVNEYSGD